MDTGQALRSAAYVAPRLPVLVSDGLWKGAGGALFREIGLITFKGKPAMLGALVGLGLAVVMILMVLREGTGSSGPDAAQALPSPFNSVLATALLYCVPTMVVAMLPALFMGRPIRDEEMISRYAMTMVPFASCVTMALISACLSKPLVLPVAAFVVAIAADRTVSEAYDEYRQVEQFRAYGEQIAEHVDPHGYTVAVVTAPDFAGDDLADDVLNARLTANWPLEKRLRFWATPAITSRGPHGTTALRGLKRPEHVDRLLLVVLDESGPTITQVPPEELKILAQPEGTDH